MKQERNEIRSKTASTKIWKKNWDKGENDKKRGKRKVIGTELYLERKRNNFKFTPKYSARFGYELKQSLEN